MSHKQDAESHIPWVHKSTSKNRLAAIAIIHALLAIAEELKGIREIMEYQIPGVTPLPSDDHLTHIK